MTFRVRVKFLLIFIVFVNVLLLGVVYVYGQPSEPNWGDKSTKNYHYYYYNNTNLIFILNDTIAERMLIQNATLAYDFVTCPNDNNTYPENTDCGMTDNNDNDNNINSEQATKEEEKAMKEKDYLEESYDEWKEKAYGDEDEDED